MSLDIFEEYMRGELLKQADLDRFLKHGIPAIHLCRLWCGLYSFINRDVVVVDGDTFEFARYVSKAKEPTVAFTFVLFDREGRPADIAAWRPPELALWKGRVFALGEEQIGDPSRSGPLRIHGSVLDWLRAGRRGVVILNHALAAWELRTTGTLAVQSEEAASHLRRLLTVPPPPVMVMPIERDLDPGEHAELHGAAA